MATLRPSPATTCADVQGGWQVAVVQDVLDVLEVLETWDGENVLAAAVSDDDVVLPSAEQQDVAQLPSDAVVDADDVRLQPVWQAAVERFHSVPTSNSMPTYKEKKKARKRPRKSTGTPP